MPTKSRHCSRRRFLAGILASAVAPIILPSRVFGRSATLPSERIVLAQIGLGARSGVGAASGGVLAHFLGVKDAQMVAVCDCYESKRNLAVSQVTQHYAAVADLPDWKGVQAYADFREVLARPDIDAVIITTPDHWHVPMAIYAILAGKDVYVEKPLSVSMEWSWKLRDIVEQYGAVFQYGTQQRSATQFRHACELVRNGYIGKLQNIEAWCPGNRGKDYARTYDKIDVMTEPKPVPAGFDYDMWLGPAPTSPYTDGRTTSRGSFYIYDNSLGFIAGWGAHPIDIAQWGNGSDDTAPVEYEGTGTIPTTGLFDTIDRFDVKCRYQDGVEMRLMDDTTASPVVTRYRPFEDHGTTFFGDEGWLSIDRSSLHASHPGLQKITLKPNDIRLYSGGETHYGKFVRCVKTREETISPIRSAINSDLVSHLSDICIRLGRKVSWNPETERILDDAQATRMLNRPLRAPWTI